jgi:starvation-inducible DNA-binding protein
MTADAPHGLSDMAIREISFSLRALLADYLALYLKTKSFQWQVSGAHFRDHRLLLDAQAGEILATTGPLADRLRQLGSTALHSVGHIARLQRILDNDSIVTQSEMLTELGDDNLEVAAHLREAHHLCAEHQDITSTRSLGTWLDQAEHRAWFLAETGRNGTTSD